MPVQELIDELSALKPNSARSATVTVCTETTDADVISIGYSEGFVKIVVTELSSRYNEGFEDGRRKGREEAEG